MYNDLYEAWRQELESSALRKLPSNFYSRIAEYVRKIREEGRMLDKRTTKARLLENEMRNASRMIRELIRARYRKLMRGETAGHKIPSDLLTDEEAKLLTEFLPLVESYQTFTENLLKGQLIRVETGRGNKMVVLRFLKDVPAIIGADMGSYGPFRVEDVASLPLENTKILIKQGLAEKVEVQ